MTSEAWQPVRCDKCCREYVCTPDDDHYRTPDGQGVCEQCLIGDLPLLTIEWPPDKTQVT